MVFPTNRPAPGSRGASDPFLEDVPVPRDPGVGTDEHPAVLFPPTGLKPIADEIRKVSPSGTPEADV